MMSDDRTKRNVQFVASLMENSAYGGLAQVFIIHAISLVAEGVGSKDPSRFKSDNVSGEDWTAVAREIKQNIDAYLEAQPER